MISSKKLIDFMMAAVIFIAAFLELVSWILSFSKEALIADPGGNYLLYWQPLLSSIVIWFFALFFLLKVFRYNACIYSQMVAIGYFIIQTINILAYWVEFGYEVYNMYIYPVFLFTILGLSVIKIIKWLSKSLLQQWEKL